ncbi:MAG: PASTA domain-containing protein [Clostridiales bacterium]|nr:PASTA domain-containing protein [Clostridiales bacterium]
MAKDNIKLKTKKRMLILLAVTVGLFLLLLGRVAWVQIVDSKWLQQEAYESQTRDRVISSKRGTIYSSDENILAVSTSIETVSVIPAQVNEPEIIAAKLSEILGLDYEETLAKVKTNQSIVTIQKRVEKEKTDLIREWILETKNEGIKIDESVERIYPNNNLASHVLGFVGTDSQGLYGIEKKYDEILTGTPGRIIAETDGRGNTIPFSSESYYAAQDGASLVLSIDSTIQHFAEKYLEQAVIDNECAKGGVAIVMEPNTGDILAMSVKPDYDLNNPFGPYNAEQELTWETIPSNEKKIIRESMWRNTAISDTYEPGSTFKVLTSAIGLDLGLVSENDRFVCTGRITVGGATMKCWRYYRPHGSQTLTESLMNSCNPAFINLGLRIGKEQFNKYVEAFGLTEKTGIDLPGETKGIFHGVQKMGEVELATSAFGQRFQVTPIGLVTAVSSMANGGKLMKPRIVKEIRNSEGEIISKIEPEVIRQVISEVTANKVKTMMEAVVAEGTGGNAYIKGYDVGGKTGTAEQGIGAATWYVASFVGIAPVENPEMVVLVALFDPQGESHGGGAIAAPVVKQIVEDSLQYLQIQKKSDYETSTVVVPDLKGYTIAQAKEILTKAKLTYSVQGTGEKIIDQIPKSGANVIENSKIILYTEEDMKKVTVTVPNVIGKSFEEAKTLLDAVGLSINAEGLGFATEQSPVADTVVEKGSIINVNFIIKEVD